MKNRRNSALFLLITYIILGACSESKKIDDYSEEELRELATTLPLEDRYQLYLELYMSSIPRNPTLAPDVAALGSPARQFVLTEAETADIEEFQAVLSVLSNFEEPCGEKEVSNLLERAKEISSDAEIAKSLDNYVMISCHLKLPPVMRKYKLP